MLRDLEIDTDQLAAARYSLADAARAITAGSDPAALTAPSTFAGSAPVSVEASRAVRTWAERMIESQDRLTGEAHTVSDALTRAIDIFEDAG